jgi:hypothetical protein
MSHKPCTFVQLEQVAAERARPQFAGLLNEDLGV